MGFNPSILLAILALLSLPEAGQAEGLAGRTVLFNVITYDDAAAPYFTSRDYMAKVGDGPEFGMTQEGGFVLDVVPVLIDIAAGRIDFSYPDLAPGNFADAAFNGYVLRFPTECVLITGAALDHAATTLPLTNADLTITPQSLSVNVAGLDYDMHTRIGVKLAVTDCPIS